MTNPPPPGNWGPPQPPYGQGQPPYGSGPWPPQQGWGPPPQPPKNNSLKWLLIGVAVLLVIAISVGATLLFTRDGGGGTTQTANGNPPAAGEIASANDTGPVSIITEDPTCEPWRPIISTLANQQRQGWDKRNHAVPSSSWNAADTQLHEATADAMRRAADQTLGLAKLTPHRIMRELYEQSVAYWRAYADSIPTYTPVNNSLAVTASDTSDSITSICGAIDNGAAAARRPLINSGNTTAGSATPPTPLESPETFVKASDSEFCDEWSRLVKRFESDSTAWREWDATSPASDWTPEHRRMMESISPIMTGFAEDTQALGAQSGNALVADFARLSSQYLLAYVQAIPSYTSADSYLSSVGTLGYLTVFNACAAVGS